MLKPSATKQFERDLKTMRKRKKNEAKLKAVMQRLIDEEPLAPRNHPHILSGKWNGRWECHIEPDWLLIDFPTEDEIIFERTGSHSDLFRK